MIMEMIENYLNHFVDDNTLSCFLLLMVYLFLKLYLGG